MNVFNVLNIYIYIYIYIYVCGEVKEKLRGIWAY